MFYAEFKLFVPVDVQDVYQLRERIVMERSHRTYNEVPYLVTDKNNVRGNFSVLCPPNSERNPSHLKGYVRHLLETGPLYHMIVPHPESKWKRHGLEASVSVKAFRARKSMTGMWHSQCSMVLCTQCSVSQCLVCGVASAVWCLVCCVPSAV